MVINKLKTKYFSITSYMVMAIVFVHLITMPFLYHTITNAYKQTTYEQFIANTTETAGLLADLLSTKKLDNNHQEIINLLSSTILGGNIQFIEVIYHHGNTLSPKDITSALTKEFKEDEVVDGNDDDIFYLSIPVYFKDNTDSISELRIGFDESTIVNDYISVKRKIAYVLSIYLIAIILFIAAITRIIHKPLYLLRDRSREISRGNLDIPLEIPSNLSEIKHLAGDLEKMRLSLVNLVENMQYKASHDDLTDLPNRYLFNEYLKQTIASSSRDNKQFAILLLDLNRFKEINDTLGHGVGDEVLRIVSSRMQGGLRESDVVARIGGDEFSFILVGVGQILAEKMACKILDLITPEFEVQKHNLKIGASVGISIYPDNGTDAHLLMSRADVAMYNAKRNNIQLASYHHEMDSDHYEKLMLANDLKKSIADNEFEALFQPKIDLISSKPCGCELLLRWNHPKSGVINPEKFIPLAEQENLIGELTLWIVKNHLQKFTELVKANENFHISINVSPVDLLDNILLQSIQYILEQNNFPKGNLYIEVTENAIMKNPVRSSEILEKFNIAGILVSIDDFGTGYSSLAYLQKFPISELKIDKSFISDLSIDSINYPIVHATITMAHDLGIAVVAEGVEDQSVLDLLKLMGCDRVQGYYCAKPMSFDAILNWLKKY